ncbi:helix-turn-helix domain-containing protein [Emticicia soli]|uniref:Helix-turn-helix domain-containing protein n=1 Tax=Emticicia soli TaxID=2027878 RepID=A0ABW5J493_9BACT
MKTLEETLFRYQLEKKITQQEMAAMLNISQATYNNWINQKSPIAPKYYPVIAKVCSIDVSPFASTLVVNCTQNNNSTDGNIQVDTLKLYQKFTQNLEEQILFLKDYASELQSKLQEKEVLIRTQQEEINLLRKRII